MNNADYEQERSQKIIDILTPKKINHGQVHTFQIAINDQDIQTIDPIKRELIEKSFRQLRTNIFPVIVRETDQDDDYEEYEVVYGVDWCLVAKELEIEKLWVWIFDLTDEQIVSFQSEMEQLIGITQPLEKEVTPIRETNQSQNLLLQEIKLLQNQVNNLTTKLDNLSANSNYVSNNLTTIIQQEVEKYLNSVEQTTPKKKKSSSSDLSTENYQKLTVAQLKEIAKKLGIKIPKKILKNQLIETIKAYKKADNNEINS